MKSIKQTRSNRQSKTMSAISRTIGIFLVIGMTQTVSAVDYEGEKSYLVEIPYKVCTIAPLPEDALKKGIVVISTQKAKALFDDDALFYDARRKTHFQKGHIKGAKEIVFDASKAQYTIIELPQNKSQTMVFYCYGETCANSYEAALAVKEFGYKNVYWYSAGYDGWAKKGYPIDK